MKTLIVGLVALIVAAIWYVAQPSIETTPPAPETAQVETANKTVKVNESRFELKQRLAKLGWSLEKGTTITTTDAVLAPASKN